MKRKDLTKCIKGHPWVIENIYTAPKTGYQVCKVCMNNRSKVYNKTKKAKYCKRKWNYNNPTYFRERDLWYQYGLTLSDFNQMIKDQDNKCAICSKNMEKPCVDHCHKTGKVRKLLCFKCNSGIGLFNDDPLLVKRALEYLEEL